MHSEKEQKKQYLEGVLACVAIMIVIILLPLDDKLLPILLLGTAGIIMAFKGLLLSTH